jgi:hypothetical protein
MTVRDARFERKSGDDEGESPVLKWVGTVGSGSLHWLRSTRRSGGGVFAEICSAAHDGFDSLQQTRYLILRTETFYPRTSCLSFQFLRRISGYQQDQNVGVSLV